MVNGIGFNFCDEAHYGAGREKALARTAGLDIAAATVVEAAHPKEALEFAEALERQHGRALIVYRKRPDDPSDAVAWQRMTPEQWVEYFRPALERGYYGALFNESWVEPPTALVDWSLRVLDITAARGWRTCHFKVSTGNPGGYGGESKLPPGAPGYRPDGYAAFQRVFERIVEINRPLVTKGQKPGAIVAPHAYCPMDGIGPGNLDRHPNVWRVVPGADKRLLTIHLGEFGVAVWRNGQPDSNAGYRAAGMGGREYAQLGIRLIQGWKRDGVIPHLFCVGRTVSGVESESFNVLHDDGFWDELTLAAEAGALRLPWWYGEPFVTTNDKPVTIIVERPKNLAIGLHVTIESFPQGVTHRNLRSDHSTDAPDIGDVYVENGLKIWEIPSHPDNGQTWRFVDVKTGPCAGMSGWLMITGIKFKSAYSTGDNPVVVEPPEKPVDPPAPPAPDPVIPPREVILHPANAAQIAAMYSQFANVCDQMSVMFAQMAATYRQTQALYGSPLPKAE